MIQPLPPPLPPSPLLGELVLPECREGRGASFPLARGSFSQMSTAVFETRGRSACTVIALTVAARLAAARSQGDVFAALECEAIDQCVRRGVKEHASLLSAARADRRFRGIIEHMSVEDVMMLAPPWASNLASALPRRVKSPASFGYSASMNDRPSFTALVRLASSRAQELDTVVVAVITCTSLTSLLVALPRSLASAPAAPFLFFDSHNKGQFLDANGEALTTAFFIAMSSPEDASEVLLQMFPPSPDDFGQDLVEPADVYVLAAAPTFQA